MEFFQKVYPAHPQDSLDQCPMPINADQNCGIDPNVDQFLSMPINARSSRIDWQFLLTFYWCLDPALIGIDRHWEELIGIDRNWSAMINIERHFRLMPWFWSALDIDWGSPYIPKWTHVYFWKKKEVDIKCIMDDQMLHITCLLVCLH